METPVLTSFMPASASSGSDSSLRRVWWRALGTVCELKYAAADRTRAGAFESAAMAWVEDFEARYSRFRPDSLLSRINAAAGREAVQIDEEMDQMLDLCGTVHFMTQGAVDVTALPLLRLWDYKSPNPRIPSAEEISAARRLVGWDKIERSPGKIFLPEAGMSLDFGGWGKEFAVDAVAQIAIDHGISSVLVDFGHDLRAIGTPPGKPAWHIGLENPAEPNSCWGSIALTNQGVASSGNYLRGFTINGRRFGHIVDSRTGWPVANGCTQVTVVAPTCLQAGIFSTAAFILGPDAGLQLIQNTFGVEGCLLTALSRYQTRGFFQHVVQS